MIRYVQLPVQPRVMQVSLPLRVLVIRSEPADFPALDLQAEWAQVADAVAELNDAGLVLFTELAAPTLSELRRALVRDTFHVLHYMGHGGFDSERGGVLLFTDRAGRAAPVTGGDLGVMFRDHTSLRLAVLNACEAARTDPADPFAGVADTLVRRGVPAVIAMQFEVTDEAAIEFAPALYGALAAGRALDTALAEARKAMYTVSPLEWATPVLYLRADDAHLFDITPAGETVPAQPQQPRARQDPADEPAPAASEDPAACPAGPGAVSRAAAHAQEGDSLYQQGSYTEAVAAYQEAIRLNPAQTIPHDNLGNALLHLKRLGEAEAAYREAIRLNPGHAPAHNNLGNILYAQKRYREAEAACREAIRLDPANAAAHRVLSNTLERLGRRSEAKTARREANRLSPSDH